MNQVAGMVARMKAAAMRMERNRWIRVVFRRFISPEGAAWLERPGRETIHGWG